MFVPILSGRAITYKVYFILVAVCPNTGGAVLKTIKDLVK